MRLRQHLVAFRKVKELREKPCMVEEKDLVRWRKAWGLLFPIRRLLGCGRESRKTRSRPER